MSTTNPSLARAARLPRRFAGHAAATLAVVLTTLLTACGGGGGSSDGSSTATAAASAASATSTSSSTHATAVSVTAEPAGKNCAAGGTRIDAGPDANDDGVLQASEVAKTQYVCNGTGGAQGLTALVKVSAEPAGTHCAQGGSAIAVGVDSNASGALDASEVTSTAYVCNGSAGTRAHSSLVVAAAEPAGTHCTYGGTRITAGLDANDSGVLDASEVSSTSYACNGAPGSGGASSGSGTMAWTVVTTSSAAMLANNGYLANSASQVVLTLPASPNPGDVVSVLGEGTGGWKIAQNAGQSILTKGLPTTLGAGALWTARQGGQSWRAVASSADGLRLVAAADSDQLYTSTDAGVTWTARDSARHWAAVASSTDGTKLLAAVNGGQLFASTDGGATWAAAGNAPSGVAWSAVTSSADGTKLLAAVNGGALYVSSDSGSTWGIAGNAPSPAGWTAVASSADGTRLAATASSGQIYVSADSGGTWSAQGSTGAWSGIASSSDGMRLVAAIQGGTLYTSTDGGASWTSRETARNWTAVASSSDGTRLVASVFNGQLYTSGDAGATWTPRDSNRSWFAVASSADGARLVAGEYLAPPVGNGQLYTSDNARTTTGTAGSLTGGQYDGVDLIYVGNGIFVVRGSTSFTGAFGGS